MKFIIIVFVATDVIWFFVIVGGVFGLFKIFMTIISLVIGLKPIFFGDSSIAASTISMFSSDIWF